MRSSIKRTVCDHCVRGMLSSALINVASEEIPCLSKEAISPQTPQFSCFSSLWLAVGFCFGAFLAANQEGNRSFLEKK